MTPQKVLYSLEFKTPLEESEDYNKLSQIYDKLYTTYQESWEFLI